MATTATHGIPSAFGVMTALGEGVSLATAMNAVAAGIYPSSAAGAVCAVTATRILFAAALLGIDHQQLGSGHKRVPLFARTPVGVPLQFRPHCSDRGV